MLAALASEPRHPVPAASAAPGAPDARAAETAVARPPAAIEASTRAGRSDDPANAAARSVDVNRLRNRDREVRAHEQAHLAAAAGIATSGPHYTLQLGPDGRLYAIGGSVDIDTSGVPGDPQATIEKAQRIAAAALAPAEPSGQDLRVAAAAAALEQRARIELQRREQQAGYAADGRPDVERSAVLVDLRA